jgi:hypothetical protein
VSSEVDAAVLALLRSTVLHVYDGYVTDSDDSAKTISAPLPYVVFYPTPGRPVNSRASGTSGREYEFQVSYVGMTREQAVWAQERAEAALDGVSITVAGKPRQITRTPDNQFVGRDDTWTRPDGGPLFYGALRFTV